MNEVKNPVPDIFRHGATWVRADFHIHTIAEAHTSRKKFRQEWLGKEDRFVGAFLDQLEKEEIRIACITNHDSLEYSEYKAIAKEARSRNILVLPGIELSVQGGQCGIHTLVVFDPCQLSKDDTRTGDFLRGQFPGGSAEDKVTQDDLAKCFEKLDKLKLDYFIVFAHVEADNGLLGAMKGPNLQQVFHSSKEIWSNRVLAFQKYRGDIHTLRQKLGDIPLPAQVEGSDPRDSISEVGRKSNGTSYLKVSDLSFSAVKFALRDHQLRVRREPVVESKRSQIISVEINTKKKGTFGHFFSADLNCLIGSRGAGKSLIIEALRWGLGKESGSGDDTYKKDLLDAFLQEGGSVVISGRDTNGNPVKITRRYQGKRNQGDPEVTISGNPSTVSIDTLFPGLLYFGQKDLGIRSEQSDSQLFAQLLGALPEEISLKTDSKLRKFREAATRYQNARKAKVADDEYAYELKALSAKLAEFKEKGVEDKLQAITAFDNDLRVFQTFRKDYEEQCNATKGQYQALIELGSRFPNLSSQDNLKARELLEIYQKAFVELIPNLTKIDDLLKEVRKGLTLVRQELELNKTELQLRFSEILRAIDEPELDLESYRTMVSRHKQLAELRTLNQSGADALSITRRDLLAAGEDWLAALSAAAAYQNGQLAEINAQLPEKINLEITPFGDNDAYNTFLEDLMRGTNFTSQAREKLIQVTSSGFEIFKRWDVLKESELTPAMATRLEEAMNANFLDFLTFAAPDSRHITFDGRRISQLSLGKRAMALLVLLLSLKNYPVIIIDQPEDDLDNETIHRMIVEPLRQHKGSTQFIIATHNPNIPVLADAEQVIACYETAKGEYDHSQSGSLDKPAIKAAIITIMEGGDEAFRRRHEIYHQWTK